MTNFQMIFYLLGALVKNHMCWVNCKLVIVAIVLNMDQFIQFTTG